MAKSVEDRLKDLEKDLSKFKGVLMMKDRQILRLQAMTTDQAKKIGSLTNQIQTLSSTLSSLQRKLS